MAYCCKEDTSRRKHSQKHHYKRALTPVSRHIGNSKKIPSYSFPTLDKRIHQKQLYQRECEIMDQDFPAEFLPFSHRSEAQKAAKSRKRLEQFKIEYAHLLNKPSE